MKESVCLQCENKRICATGVKQPNERIIVGGCSRFEQKKTITHADRIRSMTDEELTNWVVEVYHGTHEPYFSIRKIIEQGRKEFAEWLKGELKE